MERLLKEAEKIRDAKLRKLVIEIIKNPKPSHPEFRQALSIEETPAAPNSRQACAGGMVDHTLSVVDLASSMARHFAKHYKVDVNLDVVIAGALLHDIMKTVEFGSDGSQYGFSEVMLNHLDLMTAEMYKRGFPKEVIHVVASHFGPSSPTSPMTYEALFVHYADNIDTAIATNVGQTGAREALKALMEANAEKADKE